MKLGLRVKNFVSQCTDDAIVWALQCAFPLTKAIEEGNYKKIESLVEKIKLDDFAGYLCVAAEHGNPKPLQILLSGFKNRFPNEFMQYRPNSVLLSAVSKSHTECALMVLEQCQVDYKYEAFEQAIHKNMQDFLLEFVRQVPTPSNRWPEVFNRLVDISNDEVTRLALERCKFPDILMDIECESRQYIENFMALQQKKTIQNHLGTVSPSPNPTRKM